MKILWTDGSASPNPGPGGFAVLEITGEMAKPVALGREKDTTNIRMEGSAMIAAIKYAGAEGCEIHSDSEFWINVLTKWAPTWAANGWVKKSGPIKNLDLVQELYELYIKHPVKLVWEKGHAGVEFNELADQWANKARLGEELQD
ncbi:ribonuclease HI [Candidatus Saccharibacteria bacterium]|nr:ribonuclease HI [Candidatus Saccharibacteria bacterium]